MPSMMGNEKYNGAVNTAAEAKTLCVFGNRILAMEKILDAFGHVSVRNPENPNVFFISWATSPEFVTVDDLQECDFEGNVVDKAGRRSYGERILHARIYKARPDVNAVCHGHPSALLPYVCSDIPIKPVTAGGALFYDGVPVLKRWDPESGLHIATVSAGDSLAETLSGHRAALIRNHGMVAVGEYVQQMVVTAVTLAGSAEALTKVLQVTPDPRYLGAEESKQAAEVALGALGIERFWNYRVRKLKEAFPDLRDQII
jgi:ribulose-5-phosphate 4-epimerase/fuculose-1-phosphate aldolase